MTISAITQLKEIQSKLSAEQMRTLSKMGINLMSVPLFALNEDAAKALLNKVNIALRSMSNPIKDGLDERQAKLDAKKAEKTSVWENARKAYYAQLNVLHSDDTVENKEKADDLFFAMKLAGEHMVDATKRANNSAIQNILFNA